MVVIHFEQLSLCLDLISSAVGAPGARMKLCQSNFVGIQEMDFLHGSLDDKIQDVGARSPRPMIAIR